MNRLSFIRKFFAGATFVSAGLPLSARESKADQEEKFGFDDLFVLPYGGNKNLIYPKKDSIFYQRVEETFKDRIDLKYGAVGLPVHYLSIPVKEQYTWDDFLPVQFYFSCVYAKRAYYTHQRDVCFRFIKDAPDRMHLEVFLSGNSWHKR